MAVTQTQIQTTLFELLQKIAPDINPEQLGVDQDVREALGIDSYDFLNLMIGLHEAFGVEIPETDYGKLNTLSDMVHYIATHSS